MYLADDRIEKGALRQGDIVSEIHLLGVINLSSIQYTAAAESVPVRWSIPAAPNGDAMVLSHSCEIDPQNQMKVTSIILAPLRDLHKATAPEKIQELIDSNEIDRTGPQASYLKYFYLPPNEKLEFKNGAIVDFSKCFSLRRQSYETLIDNKVVQLTNDAVASMALKLALYFHRSNLTQNGND